MKFLNRGNKPKCLNGLSYKKKNWCDLKPDEREEIWKSIYEMQGDFCAYCECKLDKARHIEHFEPRKNNRRLTFEWDNLFGSCGRTSRCGHYKDGSKAKAYEIENILKPDIDDPHNYFIFNSNGRISPRKDLSILNTKKAEETIRVFNLDHDAEIVGRRRNAIRLILEEVKVLYGLFDEVEKENISLDDWNSLRDDLINQIKGGEFEGVLINYMFNGYNYL
ncbi:retron Ec78 anti-phage system effector HNH endonuclease PtuB [Marinobacterium stanieri]|uniref:TIGR02646 family protein n=1 Tax=Marinobacterium stanieri TaxID=49186 RepID=A0A1N6XXW9_9GAMM|nr:retron Ec78 anti-phage system effector HNH endonuclease PtuB [Marinobacterium stanieri]SIR07146.1 TIGR02646 family protein [Marinobacterium stanieri]